MQRRTIVEGVLAIGLISSIGLNVYWGNELQKVTADHDGMYVMANAHILAAAQSLPTKIYTNSVFQAEANELATGAGNLMSISAAMRDKNVKHPGGIAQGLHKASVTLADPNHSQNDLNQAVQFLKDTAKVLQDNQTAQPFENPNQVSAIFDQIYQSMPEEYKKLWPDS